MIAFPSPTTVIRERGGYTSGRWEPDQGFPEEIEVQAHIQPFGGRGREADMQLINRLGVQHADGLMIIFSEQELYTTREDYKADVIPWSGNNYEIISARYYGTLLPHWECLAQLVDEKTE